MKRRPTRALLAVAALGALGTGCGGVVDADQAQLCERVAPALHPDGTTVARTSVAPSGPGTVGVRLSYLARERNAAAVPGTLTCLFAAPYGEGRLDLVGVRTVEGLMDDSQLLILKRWWLEAHAGPDSAPPVPLMALGPAPAYVLQQLLNALAPMALFAALATAFTLIHGLTGRIVLAIGEVAITGGAAMLVAAGAAQAAGPLTLVHLALAVLVAVASGALWAFAIGRFVLWRFRDRRNAGQGVLIASIGLALVLREALGLQQRGVDGWLPPLWHASLPLAGSDAFAATTTPATLAAVLATGGAVALAVAGLKFSAFGRCWRAMADDPRMAELCGVAPERLLAATCLISGGLAGLAGAMLVLVFGSVDAALGLPLTLKSLAAAILGGVGSVPGAALGGMAIGLLETLWSSAFDIAYRDVVMYALLIVALAVRPQGLFGTSPRDL
ncbi:branched-chain amino acid ABC transporter permease [Azorhizobium doebereinerae]|uniref:branched-chain amino acid ABC transporter permease n=1 Tax=Azorhizobium doebereinerae TaxID=281091 RepID=UPI000490FAC2|nr:branched-chain amino acid ABC transporter permease [Azorhizobium doebereinerae]